ncbi:amino acid adenylation domain-containing protein [Streptomyces sp. NPDC052023]|uniref:amino acid adenylation domain-containing protein n=1 Tax=Streptomyces sp. NPDC052023 TaxID=3365681 RepID=UPI0037D20FDE
MTGDPLSAARADASSVHALLATRAAATPTAAAVTWRDLTLTYEELDTQANRLAHHLRARGVRLETPVALYVERSLDLVVGLLGILKAGGSYLALDATMPPERQRAVLADAGVATILTQESLLPVATEGLDVVCLDRDRSEVDRMPGTAPAVDVHGDNIAYLAYTSGSTGTPKGVAVPHRAVLRLALDPDHMSMATDDVVLQFASPAFDASTFEIWVPLLGGARLAVYPDSGVSLTTLVDTVAREGVTVLWLTAGLFHRLTERQIAKLSGLRRLLAGGDVLSAAQVDRVRALLPDLQVVNGYGPTENTTFTACHLVTETAGAVGVPIGRPLLGTGIRILDDKLRPVPDGEPGELYATGEGLARGYARRPAATGERFVADLFADRPGARMYRTGDLVRRLPDGTLEFLGRIDQQVKIRGYRVEPGETEAVLIAQAGVRDAVVVPQPGPDGDRKLVAFYVPERGARPSTLALRRRLAETLPDYAVPASFIQLDVLPLTVNGKVDRAELAERVSEERPEASAEFAPPRTELEEALATVWADRLGLTEVGVHDDFFELGGYSLVGMQITAEVTAAYGVAITPQRFYENATVASLAGVVEELLAEHQGGEEQP